MRRQGLKANPNAGEDLQSLRFPPSTLRYDQEYQHIFLGSESPEDTIFFPKKYSVYSIYSERLSDKMDHGRRLKGRK